MIEQTDRDAAAGYLAALVPSMPNLANKVSTNMTALCRAFAAHRIAAEQRGRKEGERAAIAEVVAWLLSDSARLDYEASDQEEHAFWWAADAIEARQHKASERP